MSEDLRRIAWLRLQWRSYCRLLWGATASVWLLCATGVVLLGSDRFIVRAALGFMMLVSTAYTVRLLFHARRQARDLERRAVEVRSQLLQERQASPVHPGR
ncbi:MAG: hypothetical protein AB1505_03095 [Candidatus Latescibacterota bacterium]